MDLNIIDKFLIPFISVLMSIIGGFSIYFMTQLTANIKKATDDIGELHTKISELNSNIKILLFRNDSCDKKMEVLEAKLNDHTKQIEVTRMRLHEIGNLVNGLQIKEPINWVKPNNLG